MRDYGKIPPNIWLHGQDNGLKTKEITARLMALYLYSGPHATMLGAYYLPLAYAAHDTGLSLEAVETALDELIAQDFCQYDVTHAYVWVKAMLPHQVGEGLKPGDKRVVALRRLLQGIPPTVSFRQALWECYQRDYHFGPLAPVPSQEATANTASEPSNGAPVGSPCPMQPPFSDFLPSCKTVDRPSDRRHLTSDTSFSSEVTHVFHHWQAMMQQPSARLDEKRDRIIQRALEAGYTVEQLCQAITGCTRTPYNMGHNAYGERYDSVQLILRDGDQIDRFLRHYHSPPKPPMESVTGVSRDTALVQTWYEQQQNKEDSPHE